MKWIKKGIIFVPSGDSDWAKTHAMLPTPIKIRDNILRIFITSCDIKGVGLPGYVDVEINDPLRVLNFSRSPLLNLGRPGAFDENGVVPCSLVDLGNGKFYMYYVGFEMGVNYRYRLLTGLAISLDYGETFTKYSETPVLERSTSEFYFRCGPYCIYENNVFKMWYVAGSEWIALNNIQYPSYDIRYIESTDGINWPTSGRIEISVSNPDEYGLGRPWVIPNPQGGYQMFYSVRKKSFMAYRMGYAESNSRFDWVRKDIDVGIDVSSEGFDSNALMYASIYRHEKNTYLFYNGNNFGENGIGFAVLEN